MGFHFLSSGNQIQSDISGSSVEIQVEREDIFLFIHLLDQ